MHATIRRWNGAATLIAEIERRTQEVESIISSTPGFVAYHAVKSVNAVNTHVTGTVGQDKSGTDETTRRAAHWVRDTLPADAVAGLTPEIIEGEEFVSFHAPQRLGNTTARTVNTADTSSKNDARL